MNEKSEKKRRNPFVTILVIYVILLVVFSGVLAVVSNGEIIGIAVGDDSDSPTASDNGYDFVENGSKNGVKYYVITRTTTAATESVNSEEAASLEVTSSEVTSTEATSWSKPETTAGTDDVEALSGITEASSRNSTTAETTASTVKKTTSTSKQRPQSDQKIAYLTFDDGPSINTMKLLDILDSYNVKATFFVIYHKNMEKRYKAIVDRGHTIALHSYTHTYSKIYKTESGYYNDLNKIHDYVEKVTGVDSRIIRFPGGSSNTVSRKYNKTIMATLKQSVTENGYIYHDWNVDSTDASGINRDPELLVKNVRAGLKKKKPVVNILMHDTGKSKTTTVEALPQIIDAVLEYGYKIEPLTEDSYVIQHVR